MKTLKEFLKIKNISVLILILVLTTSCEDYLKDELKSDISVDFLYSTQDGMEAATVGLYTLNREIYTNTSLENNAIALVPQAKSDLAFGFISGHLSFFARLGWGIDQNSFGTRRLDQFWKHYYRIADRSNAIIAAAENVSFTDKATKDRIVAEARCFRANSYFTLYRQFNNIFITTEPTTPDNAFDKPQDKTSVQEIFALLNSDLDFAINTLEWTTDQPGRWTKASARHLKAKVAMWQGDLVEADLQADAIINNSNYSLQPTTASVFDGDLNHSESLFVVQFEADAIGGGSRNQMNFSLLPRYHLNPGIDFSIENGGRGNGTLMMNEYVRDLLKEDPNDDRDDGNFYITAYKYNDLNNLPAGKQVGDAVDRYNEFGNERESDNFYRTMNPGCIKFRQEDGDPTQASMISNVMVYRLAETYLIGAEANMVSNPAKSLRYINAIRTRANAAPRTAPVDMQAIMDERARELAFEGQRFYFLKRTGTYFSQIQQFAGNDKEQNQARGRVEQFHVNWPIPIAELNLLGPNYPQNDGYPE